MAIGRCKLTQFYGPFVKAHLIPAALTRLSSSGDALVQGGKNLPSARRWTSWYDTSLVVQEGEDILARIDDSGIKELRRLKLIWSGWGPMIKLALDDKIPGTSWGLRTIKDFDWKLLRLFFLSLLWRAAASER